MKSLGQKLAFLWYRGERIKNKAPIGNRWNNCFRQIKVSDDGVIEDAKFKTYGCGSAIASSSLLTEWVKGKTLTEASLIKNTDIAEELALPPVKIHCSVLAEDAISAAIEDYKAKNKK